MIAATSTSASACVHETSGGRPAIRPTSGWMPHPIASPATAHAVSARAEVGRRVPRGSGGSSGSVPLTRGPRGVVRGSAAEEQDVVG